MNSRDDVEYRLKLAKGFLKEAEEDFNLKRWRSCVDETTYTLPGDILTKESTQAALSSARLCTRISKEIVENIEQSRRL